MAGKGMYEVEGAAIQLGDGDEEIKSVFTVGGALMSIARAAYVAAAIGITALFACAVKAWALVPSIIFVLYIAYLSAGLSSILRQSEFLFCVHCPFCTYFWIIFVLFFAVPHMDNNCKSPWAFVGSAARTVSHFVIVVLGVAR